MPHNFVLCQADFNLNAERLPIYKAGREFTFFSDRTRGVSFSGFSGGNHGFE